jgi:cell division protein FtsQ
VNRRPPQARDRLRRRANVRRPVRDRNRKKPNVAAWIRLGLVTILAAQGLRVAFTSPRLTLAEVRVAGSGRLSPEQVTRLGAIPVGQNIFRVNLVRVSERLRGVPFVEEAVVSRELPAAIAVELRERRPAFQIVSEGRLFHADRGGVVFQQIKAVTGEMPLLSLPAKEVPELGGKLRPELVRAVWECDRLAGAEGLDVRKMRVDGSGELWLNIVTFPTGEANRSLLQVRVGRIAELPQKFRDIRHTLTGWPDLTTRAAYLNVMCAGRPAYLRLTRETSSR